ncbi:SGNH/GDSL hydrolase family protein [Candidatus Bathyarchaeota archaeon]|nr:SGNH/GDSL hydrolase family protein [Candidatus Bathyarchaeota archaeon]
MKTILCYGDSNTWGYDPATQSRYPRDVRWPGVLRKEMGEGYLVIEEGLNGRTTVWDDPIELDKNGAIYLRPCIQTHKPLDLVIIMLGTNDLKTRFSLPAYDIASGAGVLVDIVRKSDTGLEGRAPEVLLIAPPQSVELTNFAEMFEDAVEKSAGFAKHYRRVSNEKGCHYLNAGEFVESSPLDGIHLESDMQAALGRAVAAKVKTILT